jgi:ribokinase
MNQDRVSTRNGIVVVGSANMDMVVRVRDFPRPGETIFGTGFGMFAGGKGANQAVCVARLGGTVHFVGKVGADVLGEKLAKSMKEKGVKLRHLMVDRRVSTGVALIAVDRNGQNEIVVVSGSNMQVSPDDIERNRRVISRARVVLTQLESPVESVLKALTLGKQEGAITILNPAPAKKIPKSLLRSVDYLTPNETETELLTGVRLGSRKSTERAARKLLRVGVKNVIVTLGARGSLLVNKDGSRYFPAWKVRAVDSTAAGDAFSGALAFSLARGTTLEHAIEFAGKVAAYSVTKMGAQTSMPTMRELQRFRT